MISKHIKILLSLIPLVILLGLIGLYYLFPEATFEVFEKAARTAAGFEQRRIQAVSLDFAYLEGGQGEVLLLLHGFGANKDNWTRIGRYLTPHFQVIAPDLTGFGDSGPAPDGDYSISAQVQRIDALVDVLGLSSFHLGGNSMGGLIAGAYAAAFPNKVKSLWLIAPGGVVSAEPSDMTRALMGGGANPLLADNLQEFRRNLDFMFYKEPFMPRPIKKILVRETARRRPLNMEIFRQLHDAWNANPLEQILDGLKIPTLIIWGRRDRVLHVSGAAILAAAIPNSKAVVMKAVGHLPMIEKPRETAEIYLMWHKEER
jgi:pimeloyl-ACP methyl ester carboxylesterase